VVTNFRQREILDLARKDGKVTVEGLAEHYDVTVQTIRRVCSWKIYIHKEKLKLRRGT
jgi:predicted DNA-binding transcriptional regulator YafY